MANPSLPRASLMYVCLAKQKKKAMANFLKEQIKRKVKSYTKLCLTVPGAQAVNLWGFSS